MTWCFIDTETTGTGPKDRICSVGPNLDDGDTLRTHHELIAPGRKVPPDAMAVHHITNEMLEDAPAFTESEAAALLDSLNGPDTLLVGHNLSFDLDMLYREGLTWRGGMVDTLKCTKHLLGGEIDRFSLQYLRYELRLYRDEAEEAKRLGIELRPHHALSDALHTRMLYRYLLEMADEEKLMALTTEQALVHKLTFGKYAGKYIEDIARRDPRYLEWMLASMTDLDEDLRYSIDYYLKEVRP
jgi:DNA polymerase-3 subunit epsilon/exodeoxyribonuclease X